MRRPARPPAAWLVVSLVVWLVALGSTVRPAGGGEPLAIGSRRELFVDRLLVERLEGARLALAAPVHRGTAIQFDRPWEGPFCGYATVIYDPPRYRLYYRGLPASGRDGSSAEVTCYAESDDGITWTKPELGLYEIGGSRANNVVLAEAPPFSHNFSPLLDGRPGVPDDERYKALAGTSESGLVAFASPDGIRWRRLADEPVFRDSGWVFDSQNVAFWSASEQCYLLYYRKSPEGVRSVARATSSDFRHWTAGVLQDFGGAPAEHLYTNQTHPYFNAPHLYVGVAARFFPGKQVLTPDEARAIDVDPKYFGDCSDAVLLTSRGGQRYDRTFLEALVRPGLGLENWVSRTNYPALGVVPTGTGEMSLYVQKSYGQPTARLDRYTLRTDGFASLNAPYAGGELLTRPLVFAGSRLALNLATSAAGGVRVEIQSPEGNPCAGFALDDCPEIVGDSLERIVAWRGGADVGPLAGRPVRLRIALRDADLYSLQFVRGGE